MKVSFGWKAPLPHLRAVYPTGPARPYFCSAISREVASLPVPDALEIFRSHFAVTRYIRHWAGVRDEFSANLRSPPQHLLEPQTPCSLRVHRESGHDAFCVSRESNDFEKLGGVKSVGKKRPYRNVGPSGRSDNQAGIRAATVYATSSSALEYSPANARNSVRDGKNDPVTCSETCGFGPAPVTWISCGRPPAGGMNSAAIGVPGMTEPVGADRYW